MRSVCIVLLFLAAVNGQQEGCGIVSVKDTMIVGGEDATEGAWPWHLSLEEYTWWNEWRNNCGAILISDTFAITGALCWKSTGPHRIVAGQFDMSVVSGNEQIRGLVRFTLHEDFVSSSPYPNDIAILEFDSPLDLSSDYVTPGCLPPEFSDHAGNENCWISGWGLLRGDPPSDFPDILQQANVDVLTNQHCRDFLGNSILDSHVCVYDVGGNSIGACSNDSGGPLECLVDGRYEVAGVASWGMFGCSTAFPSIYGRVSHFLDFIERETGITRKVQDSWLTQ